MVNVPKHIAIIMDGNGRWAKKRFLPRVAGHVRGVKRVKDVIDHCLEIGVGCLTLFAFGRENWHRPVEEVSFLMSLLVEQINKQFIKLHEKNIKVRFIGDRTRLEAAVILKIKEIEMLTQANARLHLNVALDYSGTYDIIQAVNEILRQGDLKNIDEECFARYLLTYPDPYPDLLIRTSGEMRLSNFMLWQLSYTEIYFTNKLWPDFSKRYFSEAISWFNTRERRYGRLSEQL